MTVPIEDQLRRVLQDRADQVRPSPPPVGLRERAAAAARRRIVLAAVAVMVAVVAAVGALGLLRDPRPEFIEPIVRPPKIFTLSESVTSSPGRALVAVFPAKAEGEAFAKIARTPHLLPATGGASVVLATTDLDPDPYSQHLSWDGTRVIRQYAPGAGNRVEIVNLKTGAINRLGGRTGFCPQLSPDNRMVAIGQDERLRLLDARTGRTLRSGPRIGEPCTSLGWSPDGRFLVMPGPNTGIDAGDSLILDEHGRTIARLGDSAAVNGSMSWSPDGHTLLLFNRASGRHVIRDVTGGSESTLEPPAEIARPLGWAGARVVWLIEQSGDFRLVTTDQTGKDPRPWIRLEPRDRVVENVQWSWDLSGRPAGGG